MLRAPAFGIDQRFLSPLAPFNSRHPRCSMLNGISVSPDASTVCRELRSLCPRNAKVINIEVTGDDRQLSVVLPKPRVSQ
jgi:hypothetical protein